MIATIYRRARVRSSFSFALLLFGVLGSVAVSASCAEDGSLIQPPSDAPRLDLQISKAVDNSAPVAGSSVVFTVTVRNNGPIPATQVFAGDTLPSGLTYVSHSASAGSFSQATGVWTVGSLGIAAEATLTLTAATSAGSAGETLVNAAGVFSAAQNDSVPANNVASVSVSVQEPTPPPIGIVFSSDWSAATGTSDVALRDGGKWNTLYCQQASETATVVGGTSVGWTKTPNVLRLQQLGPTSCGTLEKVDVLPVSTSHWGRFYFRNDEVGTQHNHVVTYNPGVGAPIQTALWNRSGNASGVNIFMRTYYQSNGSAMTYPLNVWSIGTPAQSGVDRLQNGVWYRYEWHMEYVTPTTYRIWPRIYNMAGNLLYDAERFFQSDYPQSGSFSLASWYAAGNSFGFTDVTLARRFGLGNEGPGGSTNTGGYWYHADVAISTSGWIGQ
jgi:uncharacterized repeat protein (TIGR01451 family)